MKIYHVELILCQKISNWAQLVIISFSFAVRVGKRYSKIKIFCGLFGNVEKNCGEKLDFVKKSRKLLSYPSVDEC